MAPKFGTSGLRGLVTELTPALIADHVRAFVRACDTGSGVFVGHDLRASSPRIASDVRAALLAEGVLVTDCGPVPTPALALAALGAGAGAVMVTGSHIPDDRNGLKFYTRTGELSKTGETAIVAALGAPAGGHSGGIVVRDAAVNARYLARHLTAYGTAALAGLRCGVYAHSAVGRDVLADILRALGAEVVEFARSDVFVPVDTEAVDAATRDHLRAWAAGAGLAAILSTDGDGDRPLMTDEMGEVIPGDVLGQIAAAALGAETVVTPVSSNSGAEAGGRFHKVMRTRIGSPFVIAGMEAAGGRVAGYEANGGFLLGFGASGPAGPLPPLWTRDAVLPMIAVLVASRPMGVAALVASEPARFTAADRLQEVDISTVSDLISRLSEDRQARHSLLAEIGSDVEEHGIDLTDGLRIAMDGSRVLHLRPSGNAPELRIYVEAGDPTAATELLGLALRVVGAVVGKSVPTGRADRSTRSPP